MRILYFTDTYLPQINGVTNTLDKLGRYLHKNGIQHQFFAPYYRGDAMDIQEKNVSRFRSISLPVYPECRLSIPMYANLCRLADAFKPDVVHLITPAGIGLAGLKYAQERGLPVVSSYTTSFDVYLKYYKLNVFNHLLWGFFKKFHNACHINFSPSMETIKMLESKGIANNKLWSRGIDTEVFNPTHRSHDIRNKLNIKDRIAFLYVGRIAAEKDLDILMESIMSINRLFPEKAQFIIAGDGPYAAHLKKIAPGNVVFTGYVKGQMLSSLYASCDAFVFPSSTETFGNVVLEAMSSGLPVVAVNSGGVKDSIIDGYNGFLCKPRDTQSFTQSVQKLIEDKSLIEKMGVQARQYTMTKSWQSIFDQLVFDYQMLVHQFNREIKDKAS